MRLEEVQWFAARDESIAQNIAKKQTTAERKAAIQELSHNPATRPLADAFEWAQTNAKAAISVARVCGEYPLMANGKTNLYALFAERATQLVNKNGMIGLLTPSGVYGDKTASEFFRTMTASGRLRAVFDFENRGKFFPGVHRSFKFCVFVAGGKMRRFAKSELAFWLDDVDEINDDRRIELSPADFSLVNPNTHTAPVFRNRRDAELTLAIYRNTPILNRRGNAAFPARYWNMFHMSNASHLFQTARQLEDDGFYRVRGNIYKKAEKECIPLYEGKMIWHFDHRAADIAVNPENLQHPGYSQPAEAAEKESPHWLPTPQFWVAVENIRPFAEGDAENFAHSSIPFYLGFRDISGPKNARTMVCALTPQYACGNTLPLFLPRFPRCPTKGKAADVREWRGAVMAAIQDYAQWAPLLCANFNSFAFDFICRQKMQAQHLNLFVVEQLPIIPPAAYDKKIGDKTAAALVRGHVLRLSYTAEDMRAYAVSQGCRAAPFRWDEKERRHLRARLDALFFILYGISREDAAYILSTFPIVQKNDEDTHGKFLTRKLILGYMAALAAGDAKAEVSEAGE
jgi:hypothetical protein